MTKPEEQHLIKMKAMGLGNEVIAARLQCTPAQVEQIWERLQREMSARVDSGYVKLCEVFYNLAQQHNIMGQSLLLLGGCLGEVMPETELRLLVSADVETTIANLQKKAIVLRPYKHDPLNIIGTAQGN